MGTETSDVKNLRKKKKGGGRFSREGVKLRTKKCKCTFATFFLTDEALSKISIFES